MLISDTQSVSACGKRYGRKSLRGNSFDFTLKNCHELDLKTSLLFIVCTSGESFVEPAKISINLKDIYTAGRLSWKDLKQLVALWET